MSTDNGQVVAYDPIPETVDDALRRWDADEPVFTVEMGGIGPGYEQAIQILAFEIMRDWRGCAWPQVGEELPEPFLREIDDIADKCVGRLNHLGFSGAQVGAAKSLAACVCRRGYRAALRDTAVAERLIQVRKAFPQAN